MMQNKKRKKRTTLISITLFIITMITTGVILTINSNVFAYVVDVRFAQTGAVASGGQPKNESGSYKLDNCPQILSWANIYDCDIEYDYSWRIWYNEKITINGYDMNDISLLENGLTSATPIPAGTSIGINMYSQKNVGYEVKTLNVTYKYYYSYEFSCPYRCPIGKDPETKKDIWGWCPDTCIGYGSGTNALNEETSNATLKAEYTKIKKDAITEAVADSYGTYIGTSTYEVILPDSNDIEGDAVKKTNSSFDCYYKDGTLIPREPANIADWAYGTKCQEADYTKLTEEKVQMTYFTINKACVERRTGIVRYITSSTEDCNAEEIAVENGVTDTIIPYKNEKETHWHYFIPLNAKSTDPVSINIRYHWISEKPFEQCKFVMDNNPIDYLDTSVANPIINPNRSAAPFYTELITKKTDQRFEGDYYKCANLPKDDNFNSLCAAKSTDFREILNYGCRLSMQTLLPVTQEFYLETKDENDINWLKGFNFYYKPIDISKNDQIDIIFPNGATNILGQLKNATLWENWYNTQKNGYYTEEKNLDLSKSFADKTYSAINISASDVRIYNKNNNYTDWGNMNLDGTSNYIENEGVISRNNIPNVYKLGCGPLNSNQYLIDKYGNKILKYNEETGRDEYLINLLYRKECAT